MFGEETALIPESVCLADEVKLRDPFQKLVDEHDNLAPPPRKRRQTVSKNLQASTDDHHLVVYIV